MSPKLTLLQGGGETEPESITLSEPIYIGKSFAFVNSTVDLCCAQVGSSGGKFCIDRKAECNTISHKRQKQADRAKISDGLYVLSGPSKIACFTTPFIPKDDIKNHIVGPLLDKQFSHKEALDLITTLSNRKIEENETFDDIIAVEEKINAVFNTPRKVKGDFDLLGNKPKFTEEWESRMEVIFETETSAGTDRHPLTAEVPGEVFNLNNTVTGIKDHLYAMADMLDEKFDEVHEETELIQQLFFKVKQLESAVGRHHEYISNRNLVPVVWESIANLQDQIQRVEPLIVKREQNVLKELTKILGPYKDKILKLDTDCLGLINKIGNLAVELSTVKTTAEAAAVAAKNTGTTAPTAAPVPAAPSLLGSLTLGTGTAVLPGTTSGPATGSTTNTTAAGLGIGIGGGTSRPPVPSAPGTAPSIPTAPAPPTMTTSTSSVTVLKDLTERIVKLEEYVRQKASQSLTDSTRLCSITFSKSEDVEDFMMKHGPSSHGIPKYGLFIEPLTLLHWVYAKLKGFSASQSELTNKVKLNLHEHELRAVEAYGHDVPLIYAKDSTDVLQTDTSLEKSRLSNIMKYEDFDSPGFDAGLRKRLESVLQMVVNSLAKAIESTFKNHQYVCSLAKEMLNISHKFILALHNYMVDTYTSFKAMGVGSPKQVWGLVTFVVEQLFRNDFAMKREDAIGNLDTSDRHSGFVAMWCSIKSVGLAKDLVEMGIKETPSISASYIRFVLSQSNMGKVGAMIEENNCLKRKLESTNEELAAVKKIATDAKKIADSAMSKVSNIQRENGRGGGRGNGGGGRGGGNP